MDYNKFESILDCLRHYTELDTRSGHVEGDGCLIRTIRALKEYAPPADHSTIDEIIETWDKMPKWYA